jgi:acyl-CoA ligase (AMP-forming) (exosortase A-associated)
MHTLLPELILRSAARRAEAPALRFKGQALSYAELARTVESVAHGLLGLGLGRAERVGVYLPKQFETVAAFFATSLAGGVFVPVNMLLKAEQVAHILSDCSVRILVTSAERLTELRALLGELPALQVVVIVDGELPADFPADKSVIAWRELLDAPRAASHRVIDDDMAAILYTSGSTGKPKGVVLSHRNMMAGAKSVAEYLENTAEDRLLAVLPFSFDYGFSQLSTAFLTGASVVLMDYLFARDVITMAAKERITGLAGVPPLWIQLADQAWPAEVRESLRYFTNSGGAMPRATLDRLRASLPKSKPFLMYGLTEAFRSTFLPPEEVDRRPDSMGKAIPNAEIVVVRPDGGVCGPDEPGELVHRGALVALGYWNDPAKTAERFKPAPGQDPGLVLPEIAVWSGDTVRKDTEGFLYFIGRRDEMIKTSGYRVSPTEIEEVVYATAMVAEAVVVGAPHAVLGQAIVLFAVAAGGSGDSTAELLAACRSALPSYMVPAHVEWRDALPRNANGKIDRPALAASAKDLYADRK